ncbi:bifunctional diguanylate cyclase/phosphodiesterase [Sphingosinicella sp. BN140058]|uniref:putative bifunctional diguanylate cyclase/phosphodiesterase n=1 Tax=Sphingosinicella sp. BN140058 TaxID=1892855 RepID=UPI0010123922|nr:EAL domain-containing protein [Sphingosinicella sp. BN140058]QAY77779.1 EAL domain-containing protein [Sphingosinicella sp. BN140058]
MAGIIARFKEISKIDRTVANEVRRSLVDTLFISPASLAAGALSGAALSISIAWASNDPWLQMLAAAITLCGLTRIAHASLFQPKMQRDSMESTRSEVVYELGAWAYSFLLGMLTFATLVRTDNAVYQLMAGTITTGYAAGICGRNAGRPAIAIGQLTLASAPFTIGLILTANPLLWILGVVNCLFMIGMVDITLQTYSSILKAMSATQEQKRLTARFERLARFDTMTGLENRGAFQERLEEELADAIATGDKLAVLWVDLDKFKEINDSLGHPTGDRVLCTMARHLASIAEGRGAVARFGGDEFVMLARGRSTRFVQDLAKEVMRSLSVPMSIDGVSLQVTGSVGGAIGPDHGTEADVLLQHADMALYHAKANGRNDFYLFEESMEHQFLELRNLEAALRGAIEREELQVHYQPIIDLKTGKVSSCEALLRWTHPELGPISPAKFIPIAESTGLIAPISHWVLAQACEAAAQWPDDVSVAVNMSPALLKDIHLSHMILSALYTSGLPAERLELEVTESVLLEDNVQANSLIREFQKIGLKLSIDDFGTGYSSLAYLKKYRFDKIKIDTSFIADVTRSKEARAIINALVGLADELDMEIVAEGIETETQLGYVMGARCTAAQGFFIGRPAPGDAILRRLTAQANGATWLRDDLSSPNEAMLRIA